MNTNKEEVYIVILEQNEITMHMAEVTKAQFITIRKKISNYDPETAAKQPKADKFIGIKPEAGMLYIRLDKIKAYLVSKNENEENISETLTIYI